MIPKKVVTTLYTYGLRNAAKRYTRSLILENIMKITNLREPIYEGESRRPEEKGRVMVEAIVVEDIQNKPENKKLIWNNYWEDIGDDRLYQG